MSTNAEKQSPSSSEADQDIISRVLAHVLSDKDIARAVDGLIKSVRASQLTQINTKLDGVPRNVFRQAAAVSIIFSYVGFWGRRVD